MNKRAEKRGSEEKKEKGEDLPSERKREVERKED